MQFGSESAYDTFMGHYSTRLAPNFADFAGITLGLRVLDVGAGTGALSAEVEAAPAEALPWGDETFDAALSQLVVTFMNDAPAGVREMRRVVRRGAVTGGASESGRWAASQTGDDLVKARREIRHQLGNPAGAFTLSAAAWAVRAAPR